MWSSSLGKYFGSVRLVQFERGAESKAQPQGKQINRKKKKKKKGSEHQVNGAKFK